MTNLGIIPTEPIPTPKIVLDNACSRMLSSIQESLGFSAAEDAILKWLEGCSVEGVERLTITLEGYLENRLEAQSSDVHEL